VTVAFVAFGAAIGAPLRFLIDRAVRARTDSVLPWGTFFANVGASAVLGLVAGWPANATITALVGSGFCGALSTYSTFSYETLRLIETGSRGLAVLNVLASIAAGLIAGAAGYVLGSALGR
jgi:CrcB protein